jgi:gamma-glutamylputrescine oxidase
MAMASASSLAAEPTNDSADNLPATYYHATHNPGSAHASLYPTLNNRLADSITADVCVIGGGLTGVSAALNLAERGCSVVLLEAERVGHGASGRNGGQLVSGFSCEMERIRQEVGLEISKVFWALSREALAEVKARITRHTISCDHRSGYFYAAKNLRQMAYLQALQKEWSTLYGYDKTTLVAREAVPQWVGTELYHGGLADAGGGQIHPLNYLLGLAEAARQAGVKLFEDSAVTRIDRNGQPQIHTANGQVRAKHLVLAGNAYLGGLVPELQRRLAQVSSFVGVTSPLDPALAARIMPADVAVSDCDAVLDYYRMTGDGRLLFGAGANYAARQPAALKRYLSGRIKAVFPALADIPLEHAWSGHIGVTVNRIPDFGRLGPSIHYAQGFSGHGVALTGLAGKLIAESITGEPERFDLFAAIEHRPFPGGPFKTSALVLAMAYYKLRDRLG